MTLTLSFNEPQDLVKYSGILRESPEDPDGVSRTNLTLIFF